MRGARVVWWADTGVPTQRSNDGHSHYWRCRVRASLTTARAYQRDAVADTPSSFVGTSLALALLAAGNRVTIMDDLSCGQRKNADLLQQKGAIFINADILTVESFPHAQQIYHLACPASPPFYQKDPVRTWKISVIGNVDCALHGRVLMCPAGTMRVAEWALKIGARMLFTSTSEVYGDPLQHPRRWRTVRRCHVTLMRAQRRKRIGATLTRLASALAMTRESARRVRLCAMAFVCARHSRARPPQRPC